MGSLYEVRGINGKLLYSPTNLNGEARVLLIVRWEDGDEGEIYCSPKVSKNLRDKSMSTAQLLSMPVIETKTKNLKDSLGNEIPDSGEKVFIVSLPGLSDLQELADVKPEAWSAPNVAPSSDWVTL